jgi:hypothetical protein
MITFAKLDSSILNLGKRIYKFLQFGAKSASESLPYGLDSSPIKGMTAIYATTSNDAESVIIGYIQKNQLSEVGESRLFSTDENGVLKAFIWNKKNGTIEINGSDFTAVRYAPLNTGLQAQNALINTELTKIALAISTLGGSYAPATITTDISNSESNTVKLK